MNILTPSEHRRVYFLGNNTPKITFKQASTECETLGCYVDQAYNKYNEYKKIKKSNKQKSIKQKSDEQK